MCRLYVLNIFFLYHNFWHIIFVIETEKELFMQHTQNYGQFARARAKVKERHITIHEDGQQIGILNKAKIIGVCAECYDASD